MPSDDLNEVKYGTFGGSSYLNPCMSESGQNLLSMPEPIEQQLQANLMHGSPSTLWSNEIALQVFFFFFIFSVSEILGGMETSQK